MKKVFNLFVFSMLFSFSVQAQLDTEFWFAPPELTQSTNEGAPRDRPIQLVVSTLENAAKVTIIQPADLTFVPIVLNMPANTTQIVNLTPFIERLESRPHNTVLKTGLYIKSTNSISAYYEIKSSNNTDIFALKGANSLGRKFYTPFQTNWDNALTNAGLIYNPTTFASFDIVATQDTTLVTVTPTKDLIGHPAGVPFSFTLNRGQVYSCRANDRFGANHPAGSKIESDKDVAVTIKDDMLQFAPPVPGADIAGDQLIPVDYLGKNYVLVKGGLNNNGDRCYILATEDNTIIRVDGNPIPLDTLDEGEQHELQMLKQSYFLTSNKNVCVWHISGLADQVAGAIIPSLNCTGTNRIGFTRTNSSTFIVNVITKTTAINNFTLNGNASLVPGSAFQPILGSNGWVFARISFSTAQIPAGTTLLLQNSGDELFHVGVTNYASGVGSNYGYFSNFSRLNLGSVKNVCQGDTVTIDAGPAKTLYQWSTGETTRIIRPLNPGKYWVNTLSGTQCPKTDTVIVNYYNPTFSLGPDDTICIGSSRRIIPDGVFTYRWQDGTTSPTYLATQPGKYYADVKDFQGCDASDTILILAAPKPPAPSASSGDTVCKGEIVNLTMGIVPNAFYAWADPDSNIISGRTIVVNTSTQKAGDYKAFVKIGGCESFFDTAFVGIAPSPAVSLGRDTVLCNPGGGLPIDAGEHLPGNIYLWNNGSTDSTLQVTTSGSYSVEVTNEFGCIGKDTIDVIFQTLPNQAVFNGPNAFCEDQVATFGVNQEPNFVYEWTGPNGFSFTGSTVSIPNVQPGSAGTYTVTPIINGCAGTSTDRTITINSSPDINLGKDSSSCSSFNLVLDPTPFGKGFTYLWSDGSTDSLLNVNLAGLYSVQVSNGTCTSSDNISLTFGSGPSTVTFTGTLNYCSNENASFGVVPVTGESYSWTGPNGFTLSGSTISIPKVQLGQAGQYTVTPSLPGCEGTSFSVNLIVRPSPIADLGKDTSFCPGIGIVLDPTPNGGEDVFYLWSNNLADSSILATQAGTYRVTTTLGLCSSNDTIVISKSPVPQPVTFSGTTEYCIGQSASFGVTPTGVVGYTWIGPNGFSFNGPTITIPSIQTNQGGAYKVIPFLGACPGPEDSILINLKNTPILGLSNDTSICDGNAITLDPINQGNGLTYLWSNNSTDSSIVVTIPGKYKVTVSNGTCSSSDSIQVNPGTSPAQPVTNGIITYCQGQNAIFGVDTVSGVSYSWTGPNGFTSLASEINLPNVTTGQAGIYIVTPNLNGCSGPTASISISVGTVPVIQLGTDFTICNDTSFVLDPLLNGAGLTYLWSNGSTDSSIVVTIPGKYKVTVSNGTCSASDSIQVNSGTRPAQPITNGIISYCQGQNAIFGVDTVSGVSYSWTGPNGFTSLASEINLPNVTTGQAGNYIVTPNINGCTGPTASISISVGPAPVIDLGTDINICNDTSFVLDPLLNGAGLTYLWSNGSTDSSIIVTNSGKYKVTVSNGTCSSSDSIQVNSGTRPAQPVTNGIISYCQGQNAIFGVDTVSGVSYSWTGPNGFTSLTSEINLTNITTGQAGNYIVTPNINGCTGPTASISISVGIAPVIDLGTDINICKDTSIVLDPLLNGAGLTYLWGNGSTDSSISVSTSGKYTVKVNSLSGCFSIDSINVVIGTNPTAPTITGATSFCAGNTATFGILEVAGVTYSWSGPNGFTSTSDSITITNVSNLNAGQYVVTPNLTGCTGPSSSITLSIGITPSIELGPDDTICNGSSIVLDPMASSQGFSFVWSTTSTDTSLSVSTSGKYFVTVFNGTCVSRDSISLEFGIPASTLVITGNTNTCQGQSTSLNVVSQTGINVSWTGPGGFSFNGNSVNLTNIQANQAGTYIASTTENVCPGIGDTVVLSVSQSPQIELGADVSLCTGNTITLDPTPNGKGFTYLWSNNSTDSSISVSQPGKYIVFVSNGGICTTKDSIQVNAGLSPGPVTFTNQTGFCIGGQAVFGVIQTVGVTYSWTGPNGFTSTSDTLTFPAIALNNAGQYTVTPSLNGCVGTPSNITITVGPGPVVNLGPDDTICGNTPITLDPTNGGQGFTYFWDTGNTDSTFITNQSGSYSVSVSFQGCEKKDTINLTFNPIPVPVTIQGSAAQCAGDTLRLLLQGTQPNVVYNWSGPGGFAFQGNSIVVPNISSAQTGSYSVTPAFDGCVGIATNLNINVNPKPGIELGPALQSCAGNSFILDPVPSSSGLTFLWNTGSTDTSITASQTGNYIVTVTNSSNCKSKDSILVTLNPLPLETVFTGDTVLCEGESSTFGVQSQLNISYNWTGPNGFSLTGETIQIPSATGSQAGYYVVQPVASSGCLGVKDSIFLKVSPVPSVSLGQDISICGNGPVKLKVSGTPGNKILWNTGSTSDSISVAGSGTYFVKVTNTGGCSKADTINVLIKPNPLPIQVISGSKSICENEGFNFEIQNQNGVSYSWTGPSQFTGIGNSIGFKASLLNSGSYKVTTSLNGCPGDSASILLNVKQNPTISLEYNSSVCLGTKTLVTAISRQGASFFWSDNSSLNTGNFGVGQHWVQSSFNGCSVRDTFDINNSGPIAAFVTAPDSIAIVYEKVQFLDKSVSGASPISKWEWKIGEAQIRTEQNPEFSYSTIGEFEIQLIVTDAIGCTDTLKRELIVDKPNKWFIPNLFTPDGDGKNDFFEIGLIDQYPGTSVSIFNRWGEKEFSSKDYKNEFGGKDLLEGVYYYSVKRSDGTEFNGYVYLRRN